MFYSIIDRKHQNVITVDFPFTAFADMKNMFSRNGETVTENGKEKPRLDVFPVDCSVFALVTVKSGLHSIVSKQGTATEEPRNPSPVTRLLETLKPEQGNPGLILLPGFVPSGKNLDELNRNPGNGENRIKYNIISQAVSANRKKLETALSEIDNILRSVSRLSRLYEYFNGENIETYIEKYIFARLSKCSHDTQDIFSETKTAIYCEPGTPEQKQKAGYKALHHYVYNFKKTETVFCLDDDNQTGTIEKMLSNMTGERGERNPDLLKTLKTAFKYLSKPERDIILMLSYGYNLSDVAKITGKNVGTVKTYQNKAQYKIMSIFGETLKEYVLTGTLDDITRKQEREQEKHRIRQANYKKRMKEKREQEKRERETMKA